MWFVLERLDPMPIEALMQAGEDLIVGLQRLSSDLNVSVMQYDAMRPEGISQSSTLTVPRPIRSSASAS
ncbi:hypothetical protein N5A93_08240 [Roseovarius sp. EGI FJ00037]|uniref:hypothetical protein n=1 Tax=Roseovarius salincola TaxID=2978479 RepID=UPI0022A87793|nr:hypothetical protein [Roseovarius sp. EGI FJ00037]MCZ0812217.1 hypothetical protein [Roseovarius sp. EGI FJ00037]